MMRNIFIIHGTAGYPEENWFPWLKQKLEGLGCNVIVPQFPTPQNQTPESWFKVFLKYKKHLTSDTIIIGHSLGGTFLLRFLENSTIKIKAAFFVAVPIGIKPIKNYKTDKLFLENAFDWAAIKKNCHKFFVFHSDNDPFVCVGNGEHLSKNLDVKLILVSEAGHFNKVAGYTEFPLLLEKIKKIL